MTSLPLGLSTLALLCAGLLVGCGDEQPDDTAEDPAPSEQSSASSTPSDAATPLPEGAVEIAMPGRDEPLFMVQEKHPRGGFQLRVFTDAGEEVLSEGQPLVPFLATDVSEAPTEVTCTDDGKVRVLAARDHKPRGIAAAWDLYETTYTLDGATATGTTREFKDNVLPDQLDSEYPQLKKWPMFENCRA